MSTRRWAFSFGVNWGRGSDSSMSMTFSTKGRPNPSSSDLPKMKRHVFKISRVITHSSSGVGASNRSVYRFLGRRTCQEPNQIMLSVGCGLAYRGRYLIFAPKVLHRHRLPCQQICCFYLLQRTSKVDYYLFDLLNLFCGPLATPRTQRIVEQTTNPRGGTEEASVGDSLVGAHCVLRHIQTVFPC